MCQGQLEGGHKGQSLGCQQDGPFTPGAPTLSTPLRSLLLPGDAQWG